MRSESVKQCGAAMPKALPPAVPGTAVGQLIAKQSAYLSNTRTWLETACWSGVSSIGTIALSEESSPCASQCVFCEPRSLEWGLAVLWLGG